MAKKQKDLTKERMERVAPVALADLKRIAEAELPVGDHNAHDNDKFNAVAKEVIGDMISGELKYVDKEFLFQLVLQPFDMIGQIVNKSLSESLNKAEKNLFGKEFREVTLSDLDNILKQEGH